MSKLFLVTYDLNKPGQNYSELYEQLKNLGESQHPLESTWFVKIQGEVTADDVYRKLRDFIDEKDTVFVVDITERDRQGWLAKSFWNWIKA